MEDLRDHIVLCGLGHVGARILEFLGSHKVVVISLSHSERVKRLAESNGVMLVEADVRDEDVLVRVGIEKAKALIAATDSDEVNLRVAINAAEKNPHMPIIIRIFEQSFARKIESAFPRCRALSTSFIAADHFAAASISENILSMLNIDGAPLFFCRDCLRPDKDHDRLDFTGSGPALTVSYGVESTLTCPCIALKSRVNSEKTSKTKKRKRMPFLKRWQTMTGVSKLLLIGILAVFISSVLVFHIWFELSPIDAAYFTVTVMTTTGFGDISLLKASDLIKLYGAFVMICGAAILAVLYSVIADYVLSSRLDQILGRKQHRMDNHIVVVGLGNVGYRIVDNLLNMGEKVIVIETDNDKIFVDEMRSRTPVVIGDARREAHLLAADIVHAKCITVVTDNDLKNLEIGLGARAVNPQIRVVLRAFDRDLAHKYEKSFGIDRVLSTAGIAAPSFVQAIFNKEVIGAFIWNDRRVYILRKMARDLKAGERMIMCREPGKDWTVMLASPGFDHVKDLEVIAASLQV